MTGGHPGTLVRGPPTYMYKVNAANESLLPNQTPLYQPSIYQSFSNRSGIPFVALPESTQDVRDATWLGLGTGAGGKHTDSRDTVTDISIRVINPKKKRDAKTYILKDVQPQMIRTLKCLREEILEQLGKGVVSCSRTLLH